VHGLVPSSSKFFIPKCKVSSLWAEFINI
jgi:hypothetical protein